ncbi:ABC transporter substrate-binding protein [Streptomyces sp. KLOTTS4A1]|uniref:ABC transporter substrate-binding protein n=1 Tax=Streptomyces sp. KLOTTS4A1 TaxID=3390996 RepID=UPI0039F61B4B
MSTSRRSFLGMSAAAVTAAAWLSGCGPADAGPDPASAGETGTDPLKVLLPRDEALPVQRATLKRHSDALLDSDRRGRRAEPDDVPVTAYDTALHEALADGEGPGPDLVFSWGGSAIAHAAEEHRLVDLYDLLLDHPEAGEALLPHALHGAIVNERPFGVPVRGTRPAVLFCHRRVLADLGLEPPTTWAQLKQTAKRLDKAGLIPVAAPGGDGGSDALPVGQSRWLAYLVDRIGGPETAERIRAGDPDAWGERAVVQAAEEVLALADTGAFEPRTPRDRKGTGDSSGAALLARGEAGLLLAESTEHALIARDFPAFAAADLAWVPFPALPDGAGRPGNLVGTPAGYLSMSTRTENVLGAFDVLGAFTGREHSAALLKTGEVPVTSAAAQLLDEAPHPAFARFQYELVRDASAYTLGWERAVHPTWRAPLLAEVTKLFAGRGTARQFSTALRGLEVPVAR